MIEGVDDEFIIESVDDTDLTPHLRHSPLPSGLSATTSNVLHKP
jgi:hypothetical protein